MSGDTLLSSPRHSANSERTPQAGLRGSRGRLRGRQGRHHPVDDPVADGAGGSSHTRLQKSILQILGRSVAHAPESGFQRVPLAPCSASFHNAIDCSHDLRVVDKQSRGRCAATQSRFSSGGMGAERSLSFAVRRVIRERSPTAATGCEMNHRYDTVLTWRMPSTRCFHTLLQRLIRRILASISPQSAESCFVRSAFAPFSASFYSEIECAHGLSAVGKQSRRCCIDPHSAFSSGGMGAERFV